MVNFDAVTEAVERNGEWYTFLSNLEDGYIIWKSDEYPGYELVFADWDVYDAGEIRLDDPTKEDPETGYNLTVLKHDLDGMDDDEASVSVDEFFEELADLLF
jgi:hypothetical protein